MGTIADDLMKLLLDLLMEQKKSDWVALGCNSGQQLILQLVGQDGMSDQNKDD